MSGPPPSHQPWTQHLGPFRSHLASCRRFNRRRLDLTSCKPIGLICGHSSLPLLLSTRSNPQLISVDSTQRGASSTCLNRHVDLSLACWPTSYEVAFSAGPHVKLCRRRLPPVFVRLGFISKGTSPSGGCISPRRYPGSLNRSDIISSLLFGCLPPSPP